MEDLSQLSKAERKKLKREKKRQEKENQRLEREKRKRNKKIKTYGITIFIIIAVVAFFYWRSIPPKNAPIIEISPNFHNFGMVSQSKGTVSTTMTIINIGNEDLILNNMDTSCGCTSASIVQDGQEGPRFSMSMHGTNPKNWQKIIRPGESTELKIYYDPNVHADLRGGVTRSIFIYSNDPRNKMTEVQISANQVD